MKCELHALDFLDLGGLALQRTQVVQLGAAHLTMTDHGDAAQTGAVDGESTLHTDAVGNAADGEGLADAAVALGNDHTFESLQTLVLALNNLNLNTHGIADGDRGDVLAQLLSFNRTDDLAHVGFLLPS